MLNLDRDVDILKSLVKYYVLNRAQIQRLFFASSQGDRIAHGASRNSSPSGSSTARRCR